MSSPTAALSPAQKVLIEETVEQTLLKLGLDVSNPTHVIELQQDFRHLRRWRVAVNSIEQKSVWFVVSTLLAGVLAAVWLGFKALLRI